MKIWSVVMLSAGALSLAACGAMSGPSDATIEELARKNLVGSLASPGADAATMKAAENAVAKASISKKGMCNNTEPDVYACMVDVKMTAPGQTSETAQTFVVEAQKTADGNWQIKP